MDGIEHTLWCIYDMARHQIDEDYIKTGLLPYLVDRDGTLTDEVYKKLESDEVYLKSIARHYRDYLEDRITYDDEIDALNYAIKYMKEAK